MEMVNDVRSELVIGRLSEDVPGCGSTIPEEESDLGVVLSRYRAQLAKDRGLSS